MEIPVRKVKLHEILSIVGNLKSKKASGYDVINAKLLKELPMEAINFMMHISNVCLSKCSFLDQWEIAAIEMVPKSGKNIELVQSYRPISLLPVFFKVPEIIFLNRLTPIVETKKNLTQSSIRVSQRSWNHRTTALFRKNTLIF